MDLTASLAAIITEHIPENGAVADGHPVWGEDDIRFHVNWEHPESPLGQRRKRVVMIFSGELLDALARVRAKAADTQAFAAISDAIAERFEALEADVRFDEWYFTEDLLSDDL